MRGRNGVIEKIQIGSLPNTRIMVHGSAKPSAALGNLTSTYISNLCRDTRIQGHLPRTAPEGGLREGYTTYQVDMMDKMVAEQLRYDGYSVQPDLYGLQSGESLLRCERGHITESFTFRDQQQSLAT